jgi:ABC-2 type transport system permease protein
MQRILVQAAKEWAEFKRDRLSFALAFLLPLITLLLFGFGVRMQSHEVPVTVHDENMSSLSRAYMERLFETNNFRALPCAPGDSAEQSIWQGRAKASLVIPADFEREVALGRGSNVQVLIDGSDIINARLIDSTVHGATAFFIRSLGLERSPVTVRGELRVWFNPALRESLFIVPGVYGVILWVFPALLACVATAREKEQGTIVQAYVSQISAYELLVGKALVYIALAMAEAVFIMVLGWILFDVHFAGNPIVLLITTPIYVSTAVFFGLVVGTFTNSQAAAVQGVSSGGFFTSLLLSGFVYPISNIPFPLSLVSFLVPARYFIEVSRDAFVRGVASPEVWMCPVYLLVFAVSLFAGGWCGWRSMKFKD